MKSSTQHIELLDYLRGIAILSVLAMHTLGATYGYDTLTWNGWFRDFSAPVSFLCFLPLNFAQAGVPIFFVVSGFCIHMSFQQQGKNWGSFFVRRFFRIYPAYFAALIFFLMLSCSKHFWLSCQSWEVWKQLLAHLLMVHNFNSSTCMGVNPAFWSLAVEVQLYLLYPALLLLADRFGWRHAMLLLAIIELLIRGLESGVLTMDVAGNALGDFSNILTYSPFGFWFSWGLGAAIADAFLKKQPLPFAKISVVWWLVLAGVSYFVKLLYPFRFMLFAVITAAVASRLLSRDAAKKTPGPLLNLLQKVGLWSYSIYLLHQPLLQIFSHVIVCFVPDTYRSAPTVFFLFMVTWVAVIVPFSILWHHTFEMPSIALGKTCVQKIKARFVSVGDSRKIPEAGRLVTMRNINARQRCLMIAALLAFIFGIFWAGAKFIPPEPEENNNRAWSLATSPIATNRNGELAVKLAEDACQRTRYQKTMMVGTLAAAYAEAGRFAEAIVAAQKACELATKNGETNLLQKNQELLTLYQNHQPYRERQADAGK